ncbi:hypothetical protein ABKA04_003386 [Annulohypoxylon sp. FPYF3050]
MALDFTTFDVFTTTPFQGNPLAIVQTAEDVRTRIARVDIFTPLAEVPFAGHPTIGTSNFLLHHLCLGSAKILSTKAGLIAFKEKGGGAEVAVSHNVHIHRSPFAGTPYAHHPVVSIVNGMTFILAQLPNLEALAQQTSNLVGAENTYTAKYLLDESWRHGIVVSYFFVDLGTASSARKLRTRSLGSREDPGTGSAASALCAFLSLREGAEGPATKRYEIAQGVEMGRPNEIRVQVTLSEDRKAVREILLSGHTVKVLEGRVPIPRAEVRVRPE